MKRTHEECHICLQIEVRRLKNKLERIRRAVKPLRGRIGDLLRAVLKEEVK